MQDNEVKGWQLPRGKCFERGFVKTNIGSSQSSRPFRAGGDRVRIEIAGVELALLKRCRVCDRGTSGTATELEIGKRLV